jgi:hypothetical protein
MPVRMIGGSFAPRLTPEKVAEYRDTAQAVADAQARGYMLDLCNMMDLWHQTPDFGGGAPNALSMPVTPLPEEEVQRIWDVVPWKDECDLMGQCFDKLEGDQRNAAFHLLWYAVELTNDRQPCTKDLLPADMP